MRRRAEQSVQAAIRTLRKAVSRQLFSIQVAGTEYEVAQQPAKAPEAQGSCGTGQTLQDSTCGEPRTAALSLLPSPRPGEGAREGGTEKREAAREEQVALSQRLSRKTLPGAGPWPWLPLGARLYT